MKKAIPMPHGGARPGSGRRATGKDPVRTMRLSDDFIASVDAWAAKQPDEPGRSEAIRRLVEIGLSKSNPTDRLKASREAVSAGAMKTK